MTNRKQRTEDDERTSRNNWRLFSSCWRPAYYGEQHIGFGSPSDDARLPMWYNRT
ncbi:hypothetical protein F6Y04_01590 [Bacillus megaterium]|nr:hypothetical protein [Priestia megaterium]